MSFFNKRKKDSLEKWLTPGLKEGEEKMSLQHLVAPESTEVLRKKKRNKRKDEGMSSGQRSQPKDSLNGQC